MGTEGDGDKPQQALAAERRWLFGDVLLDESSLQLFVGGQKVKIDRKPLEVLLYFLHHVGMVVTKDELHENLWPGRVLSDTVLTKTVSTLRTAIGDHDKQIVTTAHGYGYRFVAEVKVETVKSRSRQELAIAAGTRLPWKPHWSLTERLGHGAAGEAWLARHDKTFEPMVVKFARAGSALSSFRREVTLARVLRDSLGARAPIAHVKDWGLERPPYYLEVEYVNGRDLEAWVESQGGLAAVPLAIRLDIVAQIADALAAAHSVGVLHKDLKPGNVLIDLPPDTLKPVVKLCDFGSGALLDSDSLDQLKITRLGLTNETGLGTLLYTAPELLAGHVPTAKSDIYSLGMMLFQIVAGSFQKALAPGWEQEVPDPLLIEDIRLAAAGDPEARLTAAAALSERLRTLDKRAASRQADAEARAKSERLARIASELRRAQRYAAAMLLLAVLAATGGTVAYKKSREAAEANATTTAINNFLTEDVLGIDPASESPRDASYESLLGRAAGKIDERFAGRADAAATLHFILGRRLQEIGQLDAALPHYKKASELQIALRGPNSDESLLAEERYANSLFTAERLEEAFPIFDRLIRTCVVTHGADDPATLLLRSRVARLRMIAGEYRNAEVELRHLLDEIPFASLPNDSTKLFFREWAGVALINDVSDLKDDSAYKTWLKAQVESALGILLTEYMGDYKEAELVLRDSIAIHSTLPHRENELAAENDLALGTALAFQQRFEESERILRQATTFFREWLPRRHYLQAAPIEYMSVAHLQQGRWKEAIEEAREALAICSSSGCPALFSAEIRYDLSQALVASGRPLEALDPLQMSLKFYSTSLGSMNQDALQRRISLVEILFMTGSQEDAAREIVNIDDAALRALPREDHLVMGEYRRVRGLVWATSRKAEALSELSEANRIFLKRLGPSHWKTRRVAEELRKLQKS